MYVYEIELEFRGVGFCGGRKSGEPGGKKTKLYPDMTAGPGSEPGSHWWETSAIPPFQLSLCDHSLDKFSISRVNLNRFVSLRISRGL